MFACTFVIICAADVWSTSLSRDSFILIDSPARFN